MEITNKIRITRLLRRVDTIKTEFLVLWFVLTVPWVGLQCVIVLFLDHSHFFCYFCACGGWDE